MVDKHNFQAGLNYLAHFLNRRQFLRNISLIGAGFLTTIADGFLKHKHRVACALLPKQSPGSPSRIETRNSIADIWGQRTPYVDNWPVRVDQRMLTEPERWVQSACVLCSNGCGMDIGVKSGQIVGVRGRAVDRVNRGRLGPKGLHGWVANNSSDRLTTPLIRHNGKLCKASWDEAMDLIVRRSKEIREKYTSEAIGFYTSGHPSCLIGMKELETQA